MIDCILTEANIKNPARGLKVLRKNLNAAKPPEQQSKGSVQVVLEMASSKRYFFWRTLFFGKYVILVCLRLSTRMSFMGRLDTPSFVADLNAWIVVLCSEHEEYRETVDLTS